MDTDPLPALDAVTTLITGMIDLPLLAVPSMGAAQIVALVLAVLALFVSGFVSGSEIAFFSLSPAQCDELEEEGKRGERILSML